MTTKRVPIGKMFLRMILVAAPLFSTLRARAQTSALTPTGRNALPLRSGSPTDATSVGGEQAQRQSRTPVLVPSAVGTSGKATPPPDGWTEKWVGIYAADAAPRRTLPGAGNPDYGMDEIVIAHMQPWALARREATEPEVEDSGQLCKPTGLLLAGAGNFELLTAPGKITLIAMAGGGISTGGIRRIYLDRPHPKDPPRAWYGDSVGHWEGDTLVIDTIGFNDRTWLSGQRTRHSEELHIVERIRFIAPDYLERQFTVDDPLALTSPYSFVRRYKKMSPNTPVRENLCEDTPDSRRAWIKIHNRAVKDWQTDRSTQAEPQKTTGQ